MTSYSYYAHCCFHFCYKFIMILICLTIFFFSVRMALIFLHYLEYRNIEGEWHVWSADRGPSSDPDRKLPRIQLLAIRFVFVWLCRWWRTLVCYCVPVTSIKAISGFAYSLYTLCRCSTVVVVNLWTEHLHFASLTYWCQRAFLILTDDKCWWRWYP